MSAAEGPFNPDGLKRQEYYNHAVIRRGTPVFLTGQVAWDETGAVVGAGDITVQVAKAWENIGHALAGLGVGPEAVVRITTYATSRDFIPALHAARTRFFAGHDLPASTFILVAGLADPELMVEIEPVLVLPD